MYCVSKYIGGDRGRVVGEEKLPTISVRDLNRRILVMVFAPLTHRDDKDHSQPERVGNEQDLVEPSGRVACKREHS